MAALRERLLQVICGAMSPVEDVRRSSEQEIINLGVHLGVFELQNRLFNHRF